MKNPFSRSPQERLNSVRAALPSLLDDLYRVQEDANREQDANLQAIQQLSLKNKELTDTREQARHLSLELEIFREGY